MAILSDEEALAMFQRPAPATPDSGGAVDDGEEDSLVDEKSFKMSQEELNSMFGEVEAPPEPNKPSAWGDVMRGIDNLQQTGGGLAMLLGNMSDIEGIENWGKEVYDRNDMEARMNPAQVGQFTNISGPGDLLVYAREAVLENLPMFLPSAVTGGIGGMIGKRAASTLISNMAKTMTEEEIAKAVAKRVFIGSTLGSYASSAGIETGSIYGDVVDQTGEKDPVTAIGAGMLAGALDALPEGKLITNVLGPKVGKEVLDGFAKRLGVEGAKQFLREMPTEAMQTVIEEAAIVQADPTQDLFSNERVIAIMDAGLKGGLAGGGMGVVGEAMGSVLRPHPDSLVREKQREMEAMVNEQAPPPIEPEEVAVTPDDERLSKINDRLTELDEVAKSTTATKEEKEAAIIEQLPLVNESRQIEQGVPDEEGQKKVADILSKAEALKTAPEGTDIPVELAKLEEQLHDVYDKKVEVQPQEDKLLTAKIGEAAKRVVAAGTELTPEAVKARFKVDDEVAGKIIAEAKKQQHPLLSEDWLDMPEDKAIDLIKLSFKVDEAKARELLEERKAAGKSSTDATNTDSTKVEKAPDETLVNESKPDPVVAMREAKRNALETEKQYLLAAGEASGMDTQSRNVRVKEIDAQLADDQKLDTLSNEPTYKFQTGQTLPEGVDKETVQAKREEAQAAVETLVNETDDQTSGARYKGAVMGALEPHMNLFTGERVKFKRAPKGKTGGFQVRATPAGDIVLMIPALSDWNKGNQGQERSTDIFPKIKEEEAIHVAHFASIREKWEKAGKRGSFKDRARNELKKVGSWFMASQPGLAPELQNVYSPEEGMAPEDVGAEMIRMMVQRARTGKLTEDVHRQQQYAKTGIATTAFRAFMQAAQRIREIIARFLNPATSTPGIQAVYKQVNEVLDKYGAVQPNPIKPSEKAKPLVDETPEAAPIPEPRPEEEEEVLPTPKEERKTPAEINPEKEAERREAARGILGATIEYRNLLEATRQHIDSDSPHATRSIMDAATMHARIQLKKGKKLATADARRDAKQDFEANLQRKVTQADYNAGVAIAKQSAIPERGARALPEPPQDMLTGIAIADMEGNILATGDIGQTHASIKQEALGELFSRNPDAHPFADLQHGFVNSKGDFVSREKAFEIASDAGQIETGIMERKRARNATPYLESQDLLRTMDEESEEVEMGDFGAHASPMMDELDTLASQNLSRIFNPLALVNERQRRRQIGGRLRFEDFNSQEMEYLSQPKDLTFFAAKDFMDKIGGVMRTAEYLLRDPFATTSSLDGGEVTALHQLTMIGLEKMRSTLDETQADFAQEEMNRIEETLDAIDKGYAELNKHLGQMTSNAKGHERFMTGRRARKDFVGATLAKFKKKFGKKGEALVNEIREQFNAIAQKAMDKVVTRAEAIAFFRKLQKDMQDRRWKGEFLKTLATKNPRMAAIAKSVGARASSLTFDNLANEPALKEAVRRILSDMTFGMPKTGGTATAQSILSAAIADVTRDIARTAGAIPKVPVRTKITELQKLAEILQNPDLYDAFVQNLEERMVSKFSGRVANNALTDFVDRMNSRAWMDGMLESLVNEKMKALGLSIQKVARETYGVGQVAKEKVKEAVARELAAEGVTDPAVIDEIVNELDAKMEEAVETARTAFAGSGTAVRQSLREIQTTVARVAKMGYNQRSELANKMSETFIKRLGMTDTKLFPHATTLAGIIRWQLENLVQAERQNAVDRILSRAQHPELKKALTDKKGKKKSGVEKIVEYAAMGALNDPQVYNALAENLGMPLMLEDDIETVQKWGESIANMPTGSERTREILKLRNFIESKSGTSFADMMVAGMYASMLSGPSTHAVNLVSNALNLMGTIWTEGIRNPKNLPAIMRAMFFGLTRSGWAEARETLATGLAAGKMNQKIDQSNPLEYDDPVYLDRKSEVLGKLLSLTRAKYVVRFLQATDMMFYKAAQEAHFAAKTGYNGVMDWETKITEAERSLSAEGVDTTTSEGRRAVQLRAINNYEQERAAASPEWAQAWEEAHGEALVTTFNQEPKGWIGKIARLISNFTSEYPIGKLLIPFTNVVANVLNTQIEWSPFGLGRWYFSEDFKIKDADGQMVRDPRILIRSLTGMLLLGGLAMLLARYDDEEDPWFTIYGSGPKDANKKRQLYERGWKPNTIKIGGSYVSYLATPLSLSLASLGTLLDRRRDDPDISVLDYGPQLAMAFVQGTLNQSFLTGVADLFAAFESPDPERKVQRFASRTMTLWVPNLFKQIDAWADPSVQQSDDFLDMVLNQIPVVRQMTDSKPMLNVFGKPVSRVQGPLGIPFSNRFITIQQTDDPVTRFISAEGLTVPSYSKQTKIGNRQMTDDEFYSYVEASGPEVYEAIRRNIPNMRRMTKDDMQETINDLSTTIKKRTRDKMRSRQREPLTLP